jgi:glycerol-3-phosphate responsive antiterminator
MEHLSKTSEETNAVVINQNDLTSTKGKSRKIEHQQKSVFFKIHFVTTFKNTSLIIYYKW